MQKRNNRLTLQKFDTISPEKNGIYIGCEQVENGRFTNRFPNLLI